MIKRFHEFESTNEGFGKATSAIGLLIALGIGNPSQILANKPSIENSINSQGIDVLQMLAAEKDTIIAKALPISVLADTISRFNKQTGSNIDLKSATDAMRDPAFPFKIEISFIGINGKQIPVSNIEYQHSSKLAFIITKNDLWDRYAFGIRANF